MDDKIKEVIAAVSLLAMLFTIGAAIAICGALENNDILFGDAVKYGIIILAVMILGVIGIKYTEEEDDRFGNL